MFRSLMPKDEGFFDYFERVAANVHEAAILLDQLMQNFVDVPERAKQIHNLEHNGDHLAREAIEKLNRSFITPFDRDAIHTLFCRMDDVIDQIDEAVNRLVVYRIGSLTEDAKDLARNIRLATGVLKDLMPKLRTIKEVDTINNLCREIHKYESEGDRLEQHGLAKLFEGGTDPIDVIKWKDVYGDLEGALDRCEDVANIVEAIIIRHL